MQLRFSLHSDAPHEWKRRWTALKGSCEKGDCDQVVRAWVHVLTTHHIGSVTDRQSLDRIEGGIGGNQNTTDRQIRFCTARYLGLKGGDDLVLRAEDSSNGENVWTTEDLLQFGRALKSALCHQLQGGDCVTLRVALEDEDDLLEYL